MEEGFDGGSSCTTLDWTTAHRQQVATTRHLNMVTGMERGVEIGAALGLPFHWRLTALPWLVGGYKGTRRWTE